MCRVSLRALSLARVVAPAFVLLMLAGCQPAPKPAPGPQRRVANPVNFVVILADRVGHGDLGCYGQKQIATPHLDQLAKQGIRFNHFYAADPRGEATFWSLMTGHDTSRADEQEPRYVLRSENASLAEVLSRAGYDTGFFGTWTAGAAEEAHQPTQHGFREAVAILPGKGEQEFPDSVWRDGAAAPVEANAGGERRLFVTDLVAQEAVAFLQRHQTGNPFLLVVALTLPPGSESIPSRTKYEQQEWTPAQKSHAARVTEFDHAAGLILNELDKLKLTKQTTVVFTSTGAAAADETGCAEFFRSSGDLRGGQGQLYEGGLRVPCLARHPSQMGPGLERDDPAVIWDILPTFGDLCGTPEGVGQAVRIDDWKVVRPVGKTQVSDCELYDLRKDPGEQKNVADKHPDVVAKFIR